MSFNVATLAVGTEVTDGQIVDKNSALLSQLAVDLGFNVIEHRAVADDRDAILAALEELGAKVNILFVTGGLGPTSDDFTRELIAKYLKRELKFDEASWQHVVDTLNSRGVKPREIQKQQCYFPEGSIVHKNPAGTANAFSFAKDGANYFRLIALPGPPLEIKAVWKESLAKELSSLVPKDQRETLKIWRCLGRGESDLAEVVEEALRESGLRVGYRAHAPYVEVKVWVPPNLDQRGENAIRKLEEAVKPFLVNREGEDLAVDLLKRNESKTLHIFDSATNGYLSERIFTALRESNLELELNLNTSTETQFQNIEVKPSEASSLELHLQTDVDAQVWRVGTRHKGEREPKWQTVKPIYNHLVQSERGRKYICEKALQIAGEDGLAKV